MNETFEASSSSRVAPVQQHFASARRSSQRAWWALLISGPSRSDWARTVAGLLPLLQVGCVLIPLDEITEDRDAGLAVDTSGEDETSNGDTQDNGTDETTADNSEPGDSSDDETGGGAGTDDTSSDETPSNTKDDTDTSGGYQDPGGDAGAGAVCGDGVCSNGEDSSSCCVDCGCPGAEICEGGMCEPPCAETTYTLGNAWVEQSGYSELCGTYVSVAPYMHLTVSDDDVVESVWVPGGYSVELDVKYDVSVWLDWECCYVDLTEDACAGYTSVCEFDDGSRWYCECYWGREQLDGDVCSVDPIAVCDL